MHLSRRTAFAWIGGLTGHIALASPEFLKPDWINNGRLRWRCSDPLITPVQDREDPCHAIKDPSVVFDGGWHVFATIRSKKHTHQIEYLNFLNWTDAYKAKRHVLTFNSGYFCAPQVFWFTPHQKWYLIHQATDPSRKVALQPAFSTCNRIDQPDAWSKPAFLFDKHPENVRAWIDFWVICDADRAHLFFTSNDGRMWRSQTKLGDFPKGWSQPSVVLQGDVFEASHTYRLKGLDKYLTIIEAQGPGGRRYYKAYLADRIDGNWLPLAATLDKPFAAPSNVRDEGDAKDHWTDSYSHGELFRSGVDEHLEVDPSRLEFVFQGVSDENRAGKPYGEIPWKLGLLTMNAATG